MAAAATGSAKGTNVEEAPYDKPLSQRAVQVVGQGTGIFGRMRDEAKDAFHAVSNPKGKVNLGIAENKLCEEMVATKMAEIAKRPEPLSALSYGKFHGEDKFRRSLQTFITKQFHPLEPIDFENLFVVHGMTLLIESMAMALCDHGDYMMVMSPYYYRAETDIWERAGVKIVSAPILFPKPNGEGLMFDPREDILEACFQKAKLEGKNIRAINFVSPTNPSGDVYTAANIQVLLNFAHRHDLHVIANEIYGLTAYDVNKQFTSVLSVPWPDPGRVHFCWAFSKDFGLSGYHCAVLYTRNPSLQHYQRIVAYYTLTDELIQLRLEALISDEEWIEQKWLPAMRNGLRKRAEETRKSLTPVGIGVHKGSGSLFAWLDMRQFLPSPTKEGEEWLLDQLMAGGVLLLPGTTTGAPEPGFYRMVISLNDVRHNEGVKRVISVISNLPPQRKTAVNN